MKRILYEVRSRPYIYEVDGEIHTAPTGRVEFSAILPESEVYDPPPWIRRKIAEEGWSIRSTELPESGLVSHGHVNWRIVADLLHEALTTLVAAYELDEAHTDLAQTALDNYVIAVTESSLAEAEVAEPESPEDADG